MPFWFHAAGCFAIAACILAVYFPSLYHSPRADQVIYLAEVSHQKTWMELAVKDYDLNRTRIFTPGDQTLFRPLLYALLGTEKFIFGYDFVWWQLTGLLLHTGVVLLFLLICLQLCPVFISYAAAFMFALFHSNMEMVVWQHVHAYMLSAIFILTALYQVIKLMQGCGAIRRRLWVIGACLLLGVFTYEVTHIFALIIVFFLWRSRPDLRSILPLLFIPTFVYAAASWYNLHMIHHIQPQSSYHPTWLQIFSRLGGVFPWWIYVGLFSPLYPLDHGFRTRMSYGDAFVFKVPESFDMFYAATWAMIGLLFYLLTTQGKTVDRTRRRTALIMFIGTVAYYAMIVIGRGARDYWFVNAVICNLYYLYFFWLFLWLFIFLAIDWKAVMSSRWPRLAALVCAICVVFYGIRHGQVVHAMTETRRIQEYPRGELIAHIERLKREHKGPGFSVYVPAFYPANDLYGAWTRRYGDFDWKYIELLYLPYFDARDPHYMIEIGQEKDGTYTFKTTAPVSVEQQGKNST